MFNGIRYNPTICSQLLGYLFKKYFKTGRKYRYDLMCAIDAYNKQHPPAGHDDAIHGGDRTLTSTSSTQALAPLGITLHFIDQWIQCF